MTYIKLGRPKILDGERLFNYYFTSMGSARSIVKLVEYMTDEGIVNPNTGRPVIPMAVWFSLWGWAMYHSKEAYEIFNKAMSDEGRYYNEQEWELFLQEKANTCLKKSNRRFNKWLKATSRERVIPA